MAKHVTKNNNSRQKFFAVVALVGLFASGLMVGLAFTNMKYVEKNVTSVSEKIEVETALDETCEMVEKMLMPQLARAEDFNTGNHEWNIRVYSNLIKYGCPENMQKYSELLEREKVLLDALHFDDMGSICEKIETEMLNKICDGCTGAERHIDNAKIYSILAERGCNENYQKYVDLAKQELAIARALEDDDFSESDALEVVETYKRINMQAAAQEIFYKAQRLTNPAIDFILQVEKIIKE